jgi:autotransporter translocation and assembly factor TamB
MRRTRRILAIALASAGGLVVLGAGFAAFLLFTTPGGRLALRVANGRELPVRAQFFDGSLASRFLLRGVELRIGPVEAEIDTVTIAWRPRSLRGRHIDLTRVDIAGARVVVHEGEVDSLAAPQSARADTAAARWGIAIERLRVRRATVAAPGDVQLDSVDVTASGAPDGYRADVVARGRAWRIADASVFARVSGNTEGATIDSLVARTLGGGVYGGGFVRWTPGLAWNARLAGDTLRIGELAPAPEDWLGAISFRAQSTGVLHDDSTRIDVDLTSLDGTLRGRPLTARGRVSLRGSTLEASDARVTWGSARATLSGSMADVADVTLDAAIPSLAEILPRAHGSATVKGRITGTPAQFQVNVTAAGRGVRTAGRDVPDLDAVLDVSLDATNYVPHAADVRRADIRLAGGTLNVHGRASWQDAITWDVAVTARDFETGTLAPSQWDLRGLVSMRAQAAAGGGAARTSRAVSRLNRWGARCATAPFLAAER